MTSDPTAWRTSSFSSNGSNCVEVLEQSQGTWLRDSKDRDGPTLHLSTARWCAFLAEVIDDRPGTEAALRVRRTVDGGWRVEDAVSSRTLQFTAGEWQAFQRGVLAGEFDPVPPAP